MKGELDMDNYVVYHCHTDISNPNAGVDSIAKFNDYVKLASNAGMTALGISEHGCLYEWFHKKQAIENAGLKYLHEAEFYVTESLSEKVRDNYHCILIAKNKDGFYELNRLMSDANNREDGHYYYVPRITLDELCNTSDNIIVTTACVGGILCKGTETAQSKFLEFIINNKHRCFLEIQHHNTEKQYKYNKFLYKLSQDADLKLIAGTDFHCSSKEQEEGRQVLQRGKKVLFNDDESGWELTWKNYSELVESYKTQDALPEEVFLQAIENTNVMADMVEPIDIDTSFKFPKIYPNGSEVLYNKLFHSDMISRIVSEGYDYNTVYDRLKLEYETFETLRASDYILLQDYIIDWCRSHDIFVGCGRGSSPSSLAMYGLNVVEVNPLKYNLRFWRFMDKSKYSLPDVDVDYGLEDRDTVKYWMLHDHLDLPKMQTCEIITFNTIALKGAIRDIGRGLDMPLETVDTIAKAVHEVSVDEEKQTVIDDIWREKYPELFKYVGMVQGTVTSIGSHPSGIVVTDHDLAKEIGICYLAGDEYPVSVLNMKELDAQNFVKQDVLGLDTVGRVNNACKLAGISRLTPTTLNLDDADVYKSILSDCSLIFQVNSSYGSMTVSSLLNDKTYNKILTQYPKMSKFLLLSFVSALIRPCGKGIYDNAVKGIGYTSGVKEIDELLNPVMGYPILQETIMEFVMNFCGYSFLEADKLRKCVAKKLGTKEQLPIIRERFEQNGKKQLNLSDEKAEEIITMFLDCVLFATRYSFSLVHSIAYSAISYECAWLRHYYPLEFVTSCLNTCMDDEKKTNEATAYASKIGIKILRPKFRYSKSEYWMDKASNSIYKGIKSVKFLNNEVANQLYDLGSNHYNNFIELLYDINENTSLDARQLDILIKLDFFSEFGTSKELLQIVKMFGLFKQGDAKSIKKEKIANDKDLTSIVARHSVGVTKAGKESASFNNLDCKAILTECEEFIRALNIGDFSLKEKMLSQQDFMGYIDLTTGREQDRRKLIVLDEFPLKKDGRTWGHKVSVRSLGSGIANSFTILSKNYKEKINVHDIIYCEKWSRKNNWLYIDKYYVMIGE